MDLCAPPPIPGLRHTVNRLTLSQKNIAPGIGLWYKKSALARTIKKLVASRLQYFTRPAVFLPLGFLFFARFLYTKQLVCPSQICRQNAQ
jgi:hypothetical protein